MSFRLSFAIRAIAAICMGSIGGRTPVLADIINVPGDQPTIRAGIDAAVDGDEVVVADGTWTGFSNRSLDFAGRLITVRSENGPENCIIDCELFSRAFYFHSGETSEAVVEGFTITNGRARPTDPGGAQGGAVYCLNSSPTLINCLVISNIATENGGGFFCESSAPTISGCTFQGNTAIRGGGIYAWKNSQPSLTDCTVTGNNADDLGGGAWFSQNTVAKLVDCEISHNTVEVSGGGIFTAFATNLTLTDCSIFENVSNGGGGGVTHSSLFGSAGAFTMTNCLLFGNITSNGGAGVVVSAGTASITGCAFTNNTGGNSNGLGGGLRYSGEGPLVLSNCSFIDNEAHSGGGLAITGRNAVVDECLFDGNSAVVGGGLHVSGGTQGPAILSNLVIRSNTAQLGGGMLTTQQAVPTMVNAVFTSNNATGSGGGVYTRGNSFPAFINCTLSGNQSPAGGGVYNSDASCRLVNSIIWGNSGGAIIGGIALASNSCIEGGYFGENIISEDPLFVDPDGDDDIVGTDDDNLRLRAGSPCIDAGDNTPWPNGDATDLDGNPRLVDDPCTVDTGIGVPPTVDMGAYEFQNSSCIAVDLLSCAFTYGSTDNSPCDVANLVDDDDGDQILRSQLGFTLSERNLVEIVIQGNCADATTMVSIQTRDGSNTTNVVAKVKARNYMTNSIDDIAQYSVSFPSEDTSHSTPVNSADYIDANGDIEVRLRFVAPATFTPAGFRVGLDQVEVMVE